MGFQQGYARTLGVLEYLGEWNASTNTPTLTSSAGQRGGYYIISVDGNTELDGINVWNVGDWAMFNGTTWEKIDNSELVTSVAGKIGEVELVKDDVGLNNVDNTSDMDKPVSIAQKKEIDLTAYYFAIVL